ncbi:hypothetical protein BDZ91DRAFT_739667 [Kalaharituber pfeilii]|nr:hypothetical protein BDZ91DRAFT_739667 [Kalaharituber pfeilii]
MDPYWNTADISPPLAIIPDEPTQTQSQTKAITDATPAEVSSKEKGKMHLTFLTLLVFVGTLVNIGILITLVYLTFHLKRHMLDDVLYYLRQIEYDVDDIQARLMRGKIKVKVIEG